MIVTVTPNPSLDRTVELDELIRGAVLRVRSARVEPGGKGVNISRALARHELRTRAVLPCGGPEGHQLAALLAAEGIEPVLVPVRGCVRSNVSIVEPGGVVTKLNEPGPVLSELEVKALAAATVEAAAGARWLALSGSLPPGVADDFYGRIVAELSGAGARVAVDTSGPALRAALPARPAVIKPNRGELAEAAGRPVRTLGDAVRAAEHLRAAGAAAVLVSLGPDGAVLVDRHGALHGETPVTEVRSTVGAGDALLAGFLAAGGAGAGALREGLAWGTAAIGLPGSRMPAPGDLDRSAVRIHPSIEHDRILELS